MYVLDVLVCITARSISSPVPAAGSLLLLSEVSEGKRNDGSPAAANQIYRDQCTHGDDLISEAISSPIMANTKSQQQLPTRHRSAVCDFAECPELHHARRLTRSWISQAVIVPAGPVSSCSAKMFVGMSRSTWKTNLSHAELGLQCKQHRATGPALLRSGGDIKFEEGLLAREYLMPAGAKVGQGRTAEHKQRGTTNFVVESSQNRSFGIRSLPGHGRSSQSWELFGQVMDRLSRHGTAKLRTFLSRPMDR